MERGVRPKPSLKIQGAVGESEEIRGGNDPLNHAGGGGQRSNLAKTGSPCQRSCNALEEKVSEKKKDYLHRGGKKGPSSGRGASSLGVNPAPKGRKEEGKLRRGKKKKKAGRKILTPGGPDGRSRVEKSTNEKRRPGKNKRKMAMAPPGGLELGKPSTNERPSTQKKSRNQRGTDRREDRGKRRGKGSFHRGKGVYRVD